MPTGLASHKSDHFPPSRKTVVRKATTMTIYLATVDMRAFGHDYLGFFNAMKQTGSQQILETAWLVETSEPLKAVSDRLLSLLAPGDGLFLVEVAANIPWAATRLKGGSGDWLKRHRP